jgi:hypothetical protein
MDNFEAIEYLAGAQGAHLVPRRHDELAAGLPYLHVRRVDHKWHVDGHDHVGHDNESRMLPLCWYLNTHVLPRLSHGVDVSGYYHIELHDSYTYLDRPAETYDNVLVFSKDKHHHDAVVIPDMYQIVGYGGSMTQDALQWHEKRDSVVGAFTTTGHRDPAKNERIACCLWSRQHRPFCNLYITKIAQMPANDVLSLPGAREIVAPFIPREEQLRHKCILSIKGNTECWDNAWMLASNSLLLKKRHDDMCWYTPLLHDGVHFASCASEQDILDRAQYYISNPTEATWMTKNANRFVSNYLSVSHTVLYWVRLLEAAAGNR